MKKAFLVTIVALLTLFTASAGENRLKSLGAKSPMGSYLTPDDWCDPFYVNPAFAASNDSFLVMQENSLGTMISFFYSGERWTTFTLLPLHRAGFLLPYKNFRWGAEVTVTRDYYNSQHTDEVSFELSDTVFLDGKGLFAWQLTDELSIGFLLGGGGQLYDDYDSNWQAFYTSMNAGRDYRYKLFKKPVYSINFSLYENIGISLKKRVVETAFSLPFKFDYKRYIDDKGSYYFYDRYVWDTGWTLYVDRYLFDIAVDNITTFNFRDNHFLRLNSRIGLVTESFKGEYSLSIQSPINNQYRIQERLALTMHHYLKNRNHLILYGLEVTAYQSFRYAQIDSYSYNSFGFGYTISTNFGGSFKASDKVRVNFGIDTLILTSNYSLWGGTTGWDDTLRSSNYINNSSLMQIHLATNLSLGFEIRPIKGFILEVGAALNSLGPENVRFTSEGMSLAPRVDLAFTWDITELRGGSAAKDVD